MADVNAVEKNFIPGQSALRTAFANVTLSSGTGTVDAPFANVQYVMVTERKSGTGSANYAASISGRTITVHGDTTGNYDVMAFGF